MEIQFDETERRVTFTTTKPEERTMLFALSTSLMEIWDSTVIAESSIGCSIFGETELSIVFEAPKESKVVVDREGND